LLGLFTGAKSFVDNPILGSRRLNRAGLHVARLRAAHALARRRRARIARFVPAELREQFDRDGFIVIRDFVPDEEFHRLRDSLLNSSLDARAQQQGDTVTRRVPLGPELRRRIPKLGALLRSSRWRALMAYVATSWSEPLYYVQSVFGGAALGPSDPQLELHSDTFHPSLKAWLFLTDVADDGRPLMYVAGSHRLTPKRIEWERRKSIEVLESGDRLSQRGSLRVKADELGSLGLPQPTRFAVPANTLVLVDTCGFHARAASDRPSVRVELWAFCRQNPFVPWIAAGPLSRPPFAAWRVVGLLRMFDWLDRIGMAKQHWKRTGRHRPTEL
jgi:hypothetical protein